MLVTNFSPTSWILPKIFIPRALMAVAIAIASEPIRARGIILLNIYKAMYKSLTVADLFRSQADRGFVCASTKTHCARAYNPLLRASRSRGKEALASRIGKCAAPFPPSASSPCTLCFDIRQAVLRKC